MFNGLSWQMPWYLFGALAIIIPVAIHLLNNNRGRLVQFAHIALLGPKVQTATKELRLSQRILLGLRIILLLLAALFLASPTTTSDNHNKKLILISKDWLNHASVQERADLATSINHATAMLIDRPINQIQQSTVDVKEILNWQSQPTNSLNIWSKLQSASKLIGPDEKITVYTTNLVSQFNGAALPIANELDWKIKEIAIDNLAISVPSLHINIFYDADRQDDVEYLTAAFNALNSDSKVTLQLTATELTSTQNNVASGIEFSGTDSTALKVMLWLSSSSLPPVISEAVEQGAHLLMDAPNTVSQSLWQAVTLPPINQTISGVKLVNSANSSFLPELATVRWQTKERQALLSDIPFGKGKLLQFYSRFNPSWNNLVVLNTFPLIVEQLLLTNQQVMNNFTDLSPEQIKELGRNQNQNQSNNTVISAHARSPINDIIALLLLIFFVLERLYSERIKTSKNTGEMQ